MPRWPRDYQNDIRCAEDGALGIPLYRTDWVAWIDPQDLPLILGHQWHITWSRNRNGTHPHIYAAGGCGQRMHRLILGLEKGDRRFVDHIDHDGLNNRRSNLRIATRQENGRNQVKSRPSKGRFKGVSSPTSRSHHRCAWWARIGIGGRRVYLGAFETEEEAAMRYNVAAKKIFGEFAYLNHVEMG